MGVLGEMFPRKRMHEDADAAQGGQQWRLGPIDLDKGVVTVEAAPQPDRAEQEPDGAGQEPDRDDDTERHS